MSVPVKIRTGWGVPATFVTAALTTTPATSTEFSPKTSAWLMASGNSTVGMSNRWPRSAKASSTFLAGSHRTVAAVLLLAVAALSGDIAHCAAPASVPVIGGFPGGGDGGPAGEGNAGAAGIFVGEDGGPCPPFRAAAACAIPVPACAMPCNCPSPAAASGGIPGGGFPASASARCAAVTGQRVVDLAGVQVQDHRHPLRQQVNERQRDVQLRARRPSGRTS